MKEACKRAGISEPSGRKYLRARQAKRKENTFKTQNLTNAGGNGDAQKLRQGIDLGADVTLPRHYDELCREAQLALNDVALFAERYFGVILMPFQIEWIKRAEASINSDTQDFLLVNITTGAGKTTLLIILAAWLICKERRIRGMFGSATQQKAEQLLRRLSNALTRTTPIKARYSEIRSGMAKDAVSTLVNDFGIFQPPGKSSDIWRQNAIQVLLLDAEISSEKEPTWQAYGRGGDVVGNRMDFAVWDDVWRPSTLRSQDSREEFFRWWDDEAEERIEPFGTLMLAMQRLEPNDLSRWVLDKKVPLEDTAEHIANVFHDGDYSGDDFDDEVDGGYVPVYKHIVYKAHYDELCTGDHGKKAIPYPEGCLLYPKRVPYSKIARAKHTNESKYKLVYQQEDSELPNQLVHPIWISGGRGTDGVEYPGCWDKDRQENQLPDLTAPIISVITVDPSPENYWGIIWWIYHVDTEQRFLMDLDNHKLKVGNFLHRNPDSNEYSGILNSWVLRSRDLGWPVSHVIIESNSASWFFQDRNNLLWAQKMGVNVIPHDTHRNKSHAELGVTSLAEVYKFGKVRLPGSHTGLGRQKCNFLIREVTHYSGSERSSDRTDLMMSQWFFEWNLPKLIPTVKELPKVQGLNWQLARAV